MILKSRNILEIGQGIYYILHMNEFCEVEIIKNDLLRHEFEPTEKGKTEITNYILSQLSDAKAFSTEILESGVMAKCFDEGIKGYFFIRKYDKKPIYCAFEVC